MSAIIVQISYYLGNLLGALAVAVIVETIVSIVENYANRNKYKSRLPLLNKRRVIRVVILTIGVVFLILLTK